MDVNNEEKMVSLRRMLCEQGILSKSVGSSSFSQGDTVVTSAVYGPSEMKLEKDDCLEANIEVVLQAKSDQSGCYEKLIEWLIKSTCESAIMLSQYPRSNIGIIVYEMQLGGSMISCCINAACLALIDAGVALKFLFSAVSCITTAKDDIIVDPTNEQQKDAVSWMLFVFDSQDYNVISSQTKGIFSLEKYFQCLSTCRNASKSIFAFYQEAVKRKLSKSI